MRSVQILSVAGFLLLAACSSQKKINRTAQKEVLKAEGLQTAHVGISVFDVQQQKYLYNYQGEKYFVPASNTKLASLYTGLSYLGDSLPGTRYTETDDAVFLQPTGDPTLLMADFKKQPVAEWLKKINKPIYINNNNWQEKPLGYGWSWDDYNAYYMTERSAMPVYGNIIQWTQVNEQKKENGTQDSSEAFVYSDPEVNWKVNFNPKNTTVFSVTRKRDENIFDVTEGKEILKTIGIPFVTNGVASAIELLQDTLSKTLQPSTEKMSFQQIKYSQPSDSMFRIMMHRSDNFFAEQTLLMASNEKLGVMNTGKIIDTILKTQLKGFPQTPNWVDGSGLSRYNLFSPQDFVWLLNKMKQEFDWHRLTTILATGDEGTLKNYYKTLNGKLYAKTGTLSSHVAISGYLITKKNHQLIFSVLVNNHQTTSTIVRRAVEKLVMELYQKY